jgi:hypothetical protein
MKHWDGRDRTEAVELRPARRDPARVRDLLREPPRRKRGEPQIASVIGLVLAVAFLVVLGWALAPSSPVSSQLLD